MSAKLKHTLHVITMISFVGLLVFQSIYYMHKAQPTSNYGLFLNIFPSIAQLAAIILCLPQFIANFLGLSIFNSFTLEVEPKKATSVPHLCFRIVTRGLFPALVQRNVNTNYLKCVESGLDNFSIEVVTDKEVYLNVSNQRIRQIVVPTLYKTSTGALFKARALQYALEPKVSPIKEGDYIVHLDEETLLTRNSINGIVNFALDGQHSFGQGLITYTNQEIVNWITTLADSYRVADDLGKLRFQLKAFHKPLMGWKGSYVVSKYEAEEDVSFDHGPDGSIAEDCYFGMEAMRKGYSFDFIEGDMWEKSPFTIMDLIRQRKRWVQGIWLVVHSPNLPIRVKFLLAMSHYAMVILPIVTLSYLMSSLLQLSGPTWIFPAANFCFGINLYMYFFGVVRSFVNREGNKGMLFVYLLLQILILPLNILCENIAVIQGLVDAKHDFYIVGKDSGRDTIMDA